ncbi:MAG: discoidin domain-containing protein, partial [Caulobacteraceae bacterium]
MRRRLGGALALGLFAALPAAARPAVRTVVVDLSTSPLARVSPEVALGAGIDGSQAGETAALFTPSNIARMKQAGLGAVTLRLRTELGIEAWHFTDRGSWSDPSHRQGYWTPDIGPEARSLITFGYRLPRRGDTIDQANNAGYSRLDDGDRSTFWKSDPYLDPRYTGEADHPQWVVIEFARPEPIDEAVIDWAYPFARAFEAQYWIGADEYDDEGRWTNFPGGRVAQGDGGRERLRLAGRPIRARFVRILLERSSRSAPPVSRDPRDALGYAIAEVGLGLIGKDGRFHDEIRHGVSRFSQTLMHVSSTDPWHRAVDRDPNLEEPGFDLLFGSGITRGLNVTIPVAALYGSPANAAREVRYLKNRSYPVARFEIGEEPDGQYLAAEDFALLYIEAARAVRSADPGARIGGPSLESAIADVWLDPNPDRSWTSGFIKALKQRGALSDLQFFSFEHYPFDDLCGPIEPKLEAETRMLSADFARLDRDGVPAGVPKIVSEYGFSAFGGRPEVEISGALIDADIAAHSLALGAKAAFLFGYGPGRPYQGARPCAGFGDLMLFEAERQGRAGPPLPGFYESRMLTLDWAGSGEGGEDRLFPTRARGAGAIVAYALQRSDRGLAILLINRDLERSMSVRLEARRSRSGRPEPLAGPFRVVQYGKAQYAWRAAGPDGAPVRDEPPVRFAVSRGAIDLPPASLSVVQVRLPG